MSSFQFHKGTIKPVSSILLCLLFMNFNSIKVRLNLVRTFSNPNSIIYFNSIKVRLNLLATLIGAGLGLLFQFHKGTIKPEHIPYIVCRGKISIP